MLMIGKLDRIYGNSVLTSQEFSKSEMVPKRKSYFKKWDYKKKLENKK